MPADAYVMDADMKKVANAIRAKTGKADTMVFPDGFISEINKLGPIKIYGVKINRSNPSQDGAVEYIDDATGFTPMTRNNPGSWAGNPLISGIKPVLRKSDGTWQDLYKRNLASGVDITTIGNDVFTRFPTWWLSISTDGSNDYIRFSEQKIDETYFKLASQYNGVDQGMFHIGCWHAYNSGNKLYSSANKSPSVNISTENFRQYAQARGAGFDQIGYYQAMYLQALFVLLFKGRNGQEIIGMGYSDTDSVTIENRTAYDNDYGMAGSSSRTDQMSFFWINNWWGNVYSYVGGAKTNGNAKLMTQVDGKPIVSTSSNAGYVTHNTTVEAYTIGFIENMENTSTKVGFFPRSAKYGGDSSLNWCDYIQVRPSMFPCLGCAYNNGRYGGPFSWLFYNSASEVRSDIGTRLCYREAVN